MYENDLQNNRPLDIYQFILETLLIIIKKQW